MLVLLQALESYDAMRAATARIDAEGLTTLDRHGQLKGHPCAVTEATARRQYLAALASLKLDFEPIHDGPGRPAGS